MILVTLIVEKIGKEKTKKKEHQIPRVSTRVSWTVAWESSKGNYGLCEELMMNE